MRVSINRPPAGPVIQRGVRIKRLGDNRSQQKSRILEALYERASLSNRHPSLRKSLNTGWLTLRGNEHRARRTNPLNRLEKAGTAETSSAYNRSGEATTAVHINAG